MKAPITILIFALLLLFDLERVTAQQWNPTVTSYKPPHWNIKGGFLLYNKAKIEKIDRDYKLINYTIPTYMIGVEYDLLPQKRWSILTGAYTIHEPVYHIGVKIPPKDLPVNLTSDNFRKYKGYQMNSLTVPVLIRYQENIKPNLSVNAKTGIRMMIYPTGNAYFGDYFHDSVNNTETELFGMYLDTQEELFQMGALISGGCKLKYKRILLSADLVYNINFNNVLSGEYQFGNLRTSEPIRKDITFSGNYAGITLGISYIKKKNLTILKQ